MANVIELVTKYLPILDYQYQVASKTAILDADQALVQETSDAKEIKIPKMSLTGLRNYSRNAGFQTGSQTLTWETHSFTQDRASRFVVDALDDLETLGVAYGRLSQEFQRLHIIPELDAYRFSTYATKAGTVDTTAVTKANVVTLLADAQEAMDDAEVPEEGRILYVSNNFYKLMKTSTEITKKIDVRESIDSKGINFKIPYFDEMPLITVPSRRFKDKFTFLDTVGGGFEPITGEVDPLNDSKDINFLIIHPSAVMQITKRAITRIFAPTPELAAQTGAWGVTQTMDGWDIQDRLYHDSFVLAEKVNAIYVNHVV